MTLESKENILKSFSIQKYEGLESLSILDWLGHFTTRYTILEYQSEGVFPEHNKAAVAHILKDPLSHSLKRAKAMWSIPNMTIRDVKTDEIVDAFSDIRIRRPDILELFDNFDADSERVDPEGELVKVLDCSYYEALDLLSDRNEFSKCMILVNLASTDEDLKTAFSEWLKLKRDSLSVEPGGKKFRKNSTNFKPSNWIEKRVLQYLDLKILAKYLDLELTNSQIGSILFPDEYDVDVAEKTRKVVRPAADFLMSIEHLRMLGNSLPR